MKRDKIVLLGGSGIGDAIEAKDKEWQRFDSGVGLVPYVQKDDVIFIPRHDGHISRYGPAKTQYKANIIAAERLGAKAIIATSAVGSMRDYIGVESLVIPHDYVDETGRDDNLFKEGIVVHLNPNPAFSKDLKGILMSCATEMEDQFNGTFYSGTYVVIPGDRFSTLAEYDKRKQYGEIIGMTAAPEAALAQQAGLHYAVAAFPVDVENEGMNHEGGTMAVMQRLSKPDRVPAFVKKVIDKVRETEFEPLDKNLKGNIIPPTDIGDIYDIKNTNIRKIVMKHMDRYFPGWQDWRKK